MPSALHQCHWHPDHEAACLDTDVRGVVDAIVRLDSGLFLALAIAQMTQPPEATVPLEAGLASILNKLKLEPGDASATLAREMVDGCFRIATQKVGPLAVLGYWPGLRRGAVLEELVEALLQRRPLVSRREVLFQEGTWESLCLDVVAVGTVTDPYEFEAYECKVDPYDLSDDLLDKLDDVATRVAATSRVIVAVATLQGKSYLDALLEDLQVPPTLKRVTRETVLALASRPPTSPLAA